MKILFFGDSITDMGREKSEEISVRSYGDGYVFFVAGDLKRENPNVQIVNRGISGNRIVDLYARIKKDVWNHKPYMLSILVGVNDVWHDLGEAKNGVELERFKRVYKMLIEDTKNVLPDLKIVLMEPFILKGSATEERMGEFLQVKEYAKAVKELAEQTGSYFIPLQQKLDKAEKINGGRAYLYDGVHPDIAGARLIADEWINFYNENIKNNS